MCQCNVLLTTSHAAKKDKRSFVRRFPASPPPFFPSKSKIAQKRISPDKSQKQGTGPYAQDVSSEEAEPQITFSI